MKEERMTNFDWVKAFSECSLSKVFEELKTQVEADIKTRKALQDKERTWGGHYGFQFINGNDTFKVMLESNARREVVKFTLGDKSILVTDSQGETILEAFLTLNDLGECRVKINGQERELWHMRRLALEQLFFGFY